MLLVALVVALMVIGLARSWLAPSLLVFGALTLLLLTGSLTTGQALAGFANPAPLTVAALLVLARAVERTGALQPLLAAALGRARSDGATLARLLPPVAAMSALLNNTPIVALLIPPVSAWAERHGRSVSRLLMPLSFATLLGGTITLIGTSTNLVVSGLLEAAGQAPLGMFELAPVALPIAATGIVLLILSAPRLLPDRSGIRERFESGIRDFTVEMEVERGGVAVGRSVADLGLRNLDGVFLAWIRRGDGLISPVGPDERVSADDHLGFVGRVDRVVDLQSIRGLRSAQHKHAISIGDGQHRYVEAVVAPVSPLVGATLRSVDFRDRYGATVLAIHRSGHRIEGKLGEIVLHPADTLLLLTDREFRARWRDRRDFLLLSEVDGTVPVSARKAALTLVTTLAVVVLAALQWVPILHGALAASMLMVISGVLTADEARSAVDLDVVILIAASFGIGTAIEQSGLADLLAGWIAPPAAALGPSVVLGALVLTTLALTEFITNNAAAALIFPIAMAAAARTGADPRGFAVAIAIAASASFLTPIGYQTNTMVYGPGGYRFGDFARLGLPLTLLVFVGLVVLIPMQWSVP